MHIKQYWLRDVYAGVGGRNTNIIRELANCRTNKMKINTSLLTVNCPLGVSGGSQVITMVDDDNGRTCTLRGALSISKIKNPGWKSIWFLLVK